MPRFPDAIGYLLELRGAIGEAWFHALCDIAISSNGEPPRELELEHLWDCFHGNVRYKPTASAPTQSPTTRAVTSEHAFLEELYGFDGFKKLTPGLHIHFDRQLTLIFGTNGSGKSSLCQAIKVLSNANAPQEPMHNVHTTCRDPSFSYKFLSNAAASTWDAATGFGSEAQSVKYFDSTVAIKHITGALQPTAVVEVSAFNLEVFDYTRQCIRAYQRYATNRVHQAANQLQSSIDTAKQRISGSVDMDALPFLHWRSTSSEELSLYLESVTEFGDMDAARLTELTMKIEQYTAALSADGLKSLIAQNALLGQLQSQLSSLFRFCSSAPLAALQSSEIEVLQKRAASVELANCVFPKDVSTGQHHALIVAAAGMYDLSSLKAGMHACPLCNQGLGADAEALFQAYHDYLASTIQTDIATLDGVLNTGRTNLQQVMSFQLSDFSSCSDLVEDGVIEAIAGLVGAILCTVPEASQPMSTGNATQYARYVELPGYIETISATRTILSEAITAGTQNRHKLENLIRSAKNDILVMKAHRAVWIEIDNFKELCHQSSHLMPEYHRVDNYDFSSLLRSMTVKGKEAHSELVLETFEEKLDSEYRRLSGATMAEMGVRLLSRGDDQDIIVTPSVGDSEVCHVLSEGEQKVHALAVFMCETLSAPNRVLVFDDPATSFDYNYISNFCERVRDLVRDQPDTQVIILTHHWDFFTNLQITINRSGLNTRMSVQILESCATVREYSEHWDELCNEIELLLSGSSEPCADDKERVAGLMRRLIERLTNKHVFNDLRHQYKPKSLSISEFRKFTKVVALELAEADMLRDIFANLSPPEHDDPRNFYTTRSRTQFQTWYEDIHTIKNALETRRH